MRLGSSLELHVFFCVGRRSAEGADLQVLEILDLIRQWTQVIVLVKCRGFDRRRILTIIRKEPVCLGSIDDLVDL